MKVKFKDVIQMIIMMIREMSLRDGERIMGLFGNCTIAHPSSHMLFWFHENEWSFGKEWIGFLSMTDLLH